VEAFPTRVTIEALGLDDGRRLIFRSFRLCADSDGSQQRRIKQTDRAPPCSE
jgi:hypothetical protein